MKKNKKIILIAKYWSVNFEVLTNCILLTVIDKDGIQRFCDLCQSFRWVVKNGYPSIEIEL